MKVSDERDVKQHKHPAVLQKSIAELKGEN